MSHLGTWRFARQGSAILVFVAAMAISGGAHRVLTAGTRAYIGLSEGASDGRGGTARGSRNVEGDVGDEASRFTWCEYWCRTSYTETRTKGIWPFRKSATYSCTRIGCYDTITPLPGGGYHVRATCQYRCVKQ